MSNLITLKQKKVVKNEYIIRLISAILILLSILGLFVLAYVVPYYIYVKHSYLETINQFENTIVAENKENSGESMSRIVKRTLEEMKAVELYQPADSSPSIYLEKIILQKNADIKISRLSFGLGKDNIKQFSVSGISKSRAGLVNFIEDLNQLGVFNSVDSPVSDFAKDSDIPFTLSIKI